MSASWNFSPSLMRYGFENFRTVSMTSLFFMRLWFLFEHSAWLCRQAFAYLGECLCRVGFSASPTRLAAEVGATAFSDTALRNQALHDQLIGRPIRTPELQSHAEWEQKR